MGTLMWAKVALATVAAGLALVVAAPGAQADGSVWGRQQPAHAACTNWTLDGNHWGRGIIWDRRGHGGHSHPGGVFGCRGIIWD